MFTGFLRILHYIRYDEKYCIFAVIFMNIVKDLKEFLISYFVFIFVFSFIIILMQIDLDEDEDKYYGLSFILKSFI